MKILALDLGTACGWATARKREWSDPIVFDGHEHDFEFGTFDLKHGRFAGGGVRFVRFRQALDQFKGQLAEVVFEEVRRHRGTDAAHVYGGLLAILTAWCEENGIPYSGRGVAAIKIFSTGKGNADKQAVVSAVEGWGFSPRNDNEADAIALLRLRLNEDEPREPVVPVPEAGRRVARKPRNGVAGR